MRMNDLQCYKIIILLYPWCGVPKKQKKLKLIWREWEYYHSLEQRFAFGRRTYIAGKKKCSYTLFFTFDFNTNETWEDDTMAVTSSLILLGTSCNLHIWIVHSRTRSIWPHILLVSPQYNLLINLIQLWNTFLSTLILDTFVKSLISNLLHKYFTRKKKKICGQDLTNY